METVISNPTTTEPIYNGLSIRQILGRINPKMSKDDKKRYIKNCVEVYKCEKSKTNLGYAEAVKNSNHVLTKFYLTLNP